MDWALHYVSIYNGTKAPPETTYMEDVGVKVMTPKEPLLNGRVVE